MIGIYKITSPSGKIYIGQSVNITKRFYHYKSLNTKEQPRLNYSFLKYGVEKHIFEIIEETIFDLLNERERYWQEYYNVIGKNGLNCQLTNTKEKKILVSDFTKEKHKKRRGVNHPSFGKKRTDEQKIRMSLAQKKVIKKLFSEKTKLKISERMKSNTIWVNRKHSEKTKEKMSLLSKSKKIILDINTGVYYESLSELSEILKIPCSTLSLKILGKRKIKSNFIYV